MRRNRSILNINSNMNKHIYGAYTQLRHVHAKTTTTLLSVMLVAAMPMFSGCKKKIQPTALMVEDSVRHYYPVVAGDEVNISFKVVNIGDDPFLIDDIQPSCGCIVSDQTNVKSIPPHDTLTLAFTFETDKNVGYVRHCIRLFGNVLPKGFATMVFDINIVPPSDNTPDYEETYTEEKKESGNVKELVDGKASQKGYFVDPSNKTDSRTHVKYPWRE